MEWGELIGSVSMGPCSWLPSGIILPREMSLPCWRDGKCWGSQGSSRMKRFLWEGSSCRSRWLGLWTPGMGTRRWPEGAIWDQPHCSDYQSKCTSDKPCQELGQEPSKMPYRSLRKEDTCRAALWNQRIYSERPSHPKCMLYTRPTRKLNFE